MSEPNPGSRVLLVGAEAARTELRGLLPAKGWEVMDAGGVEQACFLQASRPCDVVVLHGGLAGPGWAEALTWLGSTLQRPILLVSELTAGPILEGLRQGVKWLPLEAARQHPELFEAALTEAVWRGEERRRAAMTKAQLRESFGRIDRLLGLLWEAAPGEGPTRWFSQRYMMERLDEEVARLKRRGGELSLVLGEVWPVTGEKLPPKQAHRLASWAARRLAEHKRRCDVAGRYGLDGFMLVLPRANAEEVDGACRRLAQLLARHDQPDLPPIRPCFGCASASSPGGEATVQALLRRAEERLQVARELR